MKKNEKGFMQEEKNLEKVAGGLSAVDLQNRTQLGDVNAKLELIKSQKIHANQTVKGSHNEAYNMSTNSING